MYHIWGINGKLKTLFRAKIGVLQVESWDTSSSSNEVPGSPGCVPTRVPLGDPQREGRVCVANFDNAASVHVYAETVLAIPCAAKFIPNVGKAFLQQRNEMHIVEANQLAKLLRARYVGHVGLAFRPLIIIVLLKPGILSQQTFQNGGRHLGFVIEPPLYAGTILLRQWGFFAAFRLDYNCHQAVGRFVRTDRTIGAIAALIAHPTG